MKIISVLVILSLVFPMSALAEGSILDTKMIGKLTMMAILLATALVVKMLVDRDQKEVAEIRARLGQPDRSIEFREGFDHWRMEWYEEHVYIFRNGILHKEYPLGTEEVQGGR